MARIPFPNPDDPAVCTLARQIIDERGELLDLYRALLSSPPFAEGWLRLMTAVRQRSSLPGAMRELIILRVAVINGATYEAEQHRDIALANGVSAQQINALGQWAAYPDLFSERERAVLALTDQMTIDIRVDDEVWGAVSRHWSTRETVELVATVASYNMVSRFLEALEIRPHASTAGTPYA